MKRVPQYIDAPFTILWYESDDLVPIFFGIGIGVVAEHAAYGAILGLVLASLYRKGKEEQPKNYLKMLFYRFGLLDRSKKMQALPKSWERDFRG